MTRSGPGGSPRGAATRGPVLVLPILLLLPLLFALGGPIAASAQEPDSIASGPPPDTSAAEPRASRLERTRGLGEVVLLGRTGAHLLTAPLRWDASDLGALGLAAGGVALASLLDESGRDLMSRIQGEELDRLEEIAEPFGRERALQLVGAAFVAGLVLDDARLRAVAAEGAASALVAAALIQPALAEVAGRPRPRRNRPAHTFDPFSGNISFPSGHTTTAFSLAAVVATEYRHPAARAAAYGTATAVGLARMYRGAHFFSDVVAAGLIGTAVGRSAARFGRAHRDRLRVEPALTRDGTFVVLSLPLGGAAPDRRPTTDDRRPTS